MVGHSLQNIVQRLDGLDDVQALVEHHALGALTHGSVGDLRARRYAFLGQMFQDLRRPDDGQMRRFAKPQISSCNSARRS